MHTFSRIALLLSVPAMAAVAVAACTSSPDTHAPGPSATTAGGGGDGGAGGDGSSVGGGATVGGSGGTAGNGGSGGALGIVEQCKQQACAGVPGCDGCEQLCEDWCSPQGCGVGCGVDYMVDCLEGQSCEAISSMNGLVLDADIFACLFGVPANTVCSFAASSVETCWHCTFEHCQAPLAACEADTQCHDWLLCIESQDCPNGFPQNPDCYRECDAKFPAAAPLFEAVYACTCTNCLESACAVHQDPCAVANP